MVELLLMNAKQTELAVRERTINQRHDWHLIQTADRLDRALRSVRAQLRLGQPVARHA